MAEASALLSVRGLTVGYAGSRVLHELHLDIPASSSVVIVGPNGAGKSTLLRTISGLVRPSHGTVTFDGQDVTDWPSHRLVQAGIVHVPEGRQVFPGLSVDENLRLGAFPVGRWDDASEQRLDQVLTVFPRLKERWKQDAQSLSGGEQQMLAIGRGLMGRPKLLMVDEPTLGLAPVMVERVIEHFRYIREQFDTTIVVAEQNLYLLQTIADTGYRLVEGRLQEQPIGDVSTSAQGLLEAYAGDQRVS